MLLGLGLAVAISAPAYAAGCGFVPNAVIGPCRIVAAGQSKCVDITGVSQDNGAYAQLYDCLPNQGNQQFYFYPAPGFQTYQIVARHSAKCLDVEGASQATGARVQQYDCLGYGQANQLWQWTNYQGGYIVLSPIHSWKSLSYQGVYNGAPVVQAYLTYWVTLTP